MESAQINGGDNGRKRKEPDCDIDQQQQQQQQSKTTTEEEVEEFFAIIRRFHSAVRHLQKGADRRHNLTEKELEGNSDKKDEGREKNVIFDLDLNLDPIPEDTNSV
ncbi:hypothetical protein ACHQM5_009238 [Ranunculus cassubicifolius]